MRQTGAEFSNKDKEDDHNEYSDSLYELYLNDGRVGSAFLKCLKTQPRQYCARGAVTEGLIPSFEDFATEIDAFLAQGMKPECHFHIGHTH